MANQYTSGPKEPEIPANVRLGDQINFVPTAFISGVGQLPGRMDAPRKLRGRVIYIHPRRRFLTLEAEVHGTLLRESFCMKERGF